MSSAEALADRVFEALARAPTEGRYAARLAAILRALAMRELGAPGWDRLPALGDEPGRALAELTTGPLEAEDIGGVYEELMGHAYVRLAHPAARVRTRRGGRGVWVDAQQLLALDPGRRAGWLRRRCGFDRRAADELAAAIEAAAPDRVLALLGTTRAAAGRVVIQPDDGRRRSASHYTPRALTRPIVARTLAPLLARLAREGDGPRSDAITALCVVDPAMGTGAFLLEVVRQLADALLAAWRREARAGSPTDARRLIAARCVFGVDSNPGAVELARLSLWMLVGDPTLDPAFADAHLRRGDSLLGLDGEQLHALDWRADADAHPHVRAGETSRDDARLGADLCLAAFFAGDASEPRRAARAEHLDAWLAHLDARDDQTRARVERLRAAGLGARVPFHWPVDGPARVDAVVGNPPFMGGSQLSGTFGPGYRDWLLLRAGAHGNSDLCAHFFRLAAALLADGGCFGLVATNTIGQGDTRTTGLAPLLAEGAVIYDATPELAWPAAAAAVTVSVVHLARGRLADEAEHATGGATLRTLDADGELAPRRVACINSYLEPRRERPDPRALAPNDGLAWLGSKIYGQGFVLAPARREALLAADPRNAACIKPYIGGAAINRHPDQAHARFVIDFGDLSLAEAERWPQLLDIVRATVKPERERNKRTWRRRNWWKYGERAPSLYAAIDGLPRCLVSARLTKHLCVSWQRPGAVFSEQLVIFAVDADTCFAILQSRVHERWARALSSSMETRLRYAPSDCFSSFPFPGGDPRRRFTRLETIGARVEQTRRALMLDHEIGLTTTYNLLLGLEPDHPDHAAAADPRVAQLRTLHVELDRAVLDTYAEQLRDDAPALAERLAAVAVPPYLDPRRRDLDAADADALRRFEDEVLDCLAALNRRRAGF